MTELLRAKQVADLAGCTPRTVNRAVRLGKIEAAQVLGQGMPVLFTQAEAHRYAEWWKAGSR